MRAEQRAARSRAEFEPRDKRWIPYTVHGDKAGRKAKVTVRKGDRYAVVDDVGEGTVVLDVSDWPRLDHGGRLYWDTEPVELVCPLATAQQVIDTHREQAGVTAPDRPLRVGDTFLLRGWQGEDLADATRIIDVSSAARDAAKTALYAAVAPTATATTAAMKPPTELRYDDADPSEGYFDVRQQAPAAAPPAAAPQSKPPGKRPGGPKAAR